MQYPVIDLHCDLLLYLQMGKERTPLDPLSRASAPQLKAGNVKLQTLAIFTTNTAEATSSCKEQLEIFLKLPHLYPDHFAKFEPQIDLSDKTQIIASFENAMGFCAPLEPIEKGLKELDRIRKLLKHIGYISLTWDGENRFGGGNGSKAGLKEDGKKMLHWMSDKSIPVDISHASDFLVDDIFNYIDKKSLDVPVIASHSNARYVTNMPRNLPDEFIREIIKRKGLIGLNFFTAFSGDKDPHALIKHIQHIYELKGQECLGLGADFFCLDDFPALRQKYGKSVGFYKEISDSSTYPYFLRLAQEKLKLSQQEMRALSHQNAQNFYRTLYHKIG